MTFGSVFLGGILVMPPAQEATEFRSLPSLTGIHPDTLAEVSHTLLRLERDRAEWMQRKQHAAEVVEDIRRLLKRLEEAEKRQK